MLVCLIGLFLLVLPSFDRDSEAQTNTNSLTEGVSLTLSADKRVVDVAKSDDKITFTATLTRNGQPLSNYPIRGINGSELFPDKNGKIGETGLRTDASGKAEFTYVAGNRVEDIVDISAVANLALSAEQPIARGLVGIAYGQSESEDTEWKAEETTASPNVTIVRNTEATPDYNQEAAQPNIMDTVEQPASEGDGSSTGGQSESSYPVVVTLNVPEYIGANDTSFSVGGSLTYNGNRQLGTVEISVTTSDGAEISPAKTTRTAGNAGNSSFLSAQFMVPRGDREITVTAVGYVDLSNDSGGRSRNNTSETTTIRFDQGMPSSEEAISGSEDQDNQGGPGDTNDTSGDSQTQTGSIDLTVNRSESSASLETSMFPLKISARYNGNPIAVKIKTFGDGQFTTVKSIGGADGDYATTFQPNTKGGIVPLKFDATATLNGKSLSGEADYSLNTAYNNPLASDRVRKIAVNAGATELNPPTRNVGEHTYFGYASDLRGGKSAGRDHFSIIDKLGGEGNGYASIDVSITGGDGTPVPNAAVEARVTTPGTIAKSGSVACDTSTTSYCPTGGDVYKTITANTNDKGTLTVYFFAGISSRSATVSFRHRFYSDVDGWTYAETDPTEVTFTVKGGRSSVTGGLSSGDGSPGSGSDGSDSGDGSAGRGGDEDYIHDPDDLLELEVSPGSLSFTLNPDGTAPAAQKITITASLKNPDKVSGSATLIVHAPMDSGVNVDKGNRNNAGNNLKYTIGKSRESLPVSVYPVTATSSRSARINIHIEGKNVNQVDIEQWRYVDVTIKKATDLNEGKDLNQIEAEILDLANKIEIKRDVADPDIAGGKSDNRFTVSIDRNKVIEAESRLSDMYLKVYVIGDTSDSNIRYYIGNSTKPVLKLPELSIKGEDAKITVSSATGVPEGSFVWLKVVEIRYTAGSATNKKNPVPYNGKVLPEGTSSDNDNNTNTQEFEFDPNAPLQGTNMQSSANDIWNRVKDFSFLSKTNKDKIKAELDKIATQTGYGDKYGLGNVRQIIRNGLAGSGTHPVPQTDPEYQEAYDALGDLGMDIYMDRIYRDDNKSERFKKAAKQAGEAAKQGNWSALDWLIDEAGSWNRPDSSISNYRQAGDYEQTSFYADGTRQQRDASGKPITNSGSSGSGSSSSGSSSSGSGSNLLGPTTQLNSISSLFNISGAMADTGQAVAGAAVNIVTILINGIRNIFN
ncbi:hypothetical protein JXA59_01755 [Patescibacteria group bacterium]|nr:hypothetical protein [Patescibacteria group bacterium]